MPTRIISLFFIIFLAGSLLFPAVSFAGGTYKVDGSNVCYEGLVPCGSIIYEDARYENGKCEEGKMLTYQEDPQKVRCRLCHLFIMLDGIVDFVMFTLVPVVAVLMLVIAGIMFIMHQLGGTDLLAGGGSGGPAMLNQAKRLLSSVVMGLVIIYTAWIIVNTFLAIIGVANTEFGTAIRNWFSIDCKIP